MSGLLRGEDGIIRCAWCGTDPFYIAYHDDEWGRPVDNDGRLFEKICLEGFQAGLSWITILRKREAFRKAFAGFDYKKIARFAEKDVERLLKDQGIIRHRGKIESTINNAQKVSEIIGEFGSLGVYFWSFEPKPSSRPNILDYAALKKLTMSPESIALAKDLKKRGFRFLGPTTLYAHMQAMGLVNDHIEGCHMRPRVEAMRKSFKRPTKI